MNGDTNKHFWDQRWKDKNTGWDLNQVSPPIKEYSASIKDKSIAILIPGCGNAHEAEYLLKSHFAKVSVIDISPTLVAALKKKFVGKPIKIILGDFFEHKGKYDLILEQTFFCAINPETRKQYVEKCFQLLKPHGKIAGVLFGKTFEKEGPPHGGSSAEYKKLFSKRFKLNRLEVCQNSIEPRQGSELFIEFEKK